MEGVQITGALVAGKARHTCFSESALHGVSGPSPTLYSSAVQPMTVSSPRSPSLSPAHRSSGFSCGGTQDAA